jgi:hypothetical protein
MNFVSDESAHMLVISKHWRQSSSESMQSHTIQDYPQHWPVSSGILMLVLYLKPTSFLNTYEVSLTG